MISLYDRLKKGKVVVVDIETSGLFCGEEGKENAYILEIAALRLDHFHEAERFHSYVACPVSLPEEISVLTGITDEMLAGAPPVEQVLKDFAAFSESAILVGHNLPFDCKFLDYYGAKYGIAFSQDRVDMLPLAKRMLGKRVENFKLQTIADEIYSGCKDKNKKLETCMQCAEVIAESVWLLSELQKDRFNSVPYYRIIVQRRRIRREIWYVEHIIGENLMRCALFGENHPLFPLWVYKCAEKLEYVSRFVDRKGEKLPRHYYESIFTGQNEAVWETKDWLEGRGLRNDGDYEVTDELCEKVFAIYDAVRVSCMPYLMSRTETYHPNQYASIIVQAVETEGKNREIKIDYDNLYTKYAIYGN